MPPKNKSKPPAPPTPEPAPVRPAPGRAERNDTFMSKEELAAELGIHPATLLRWHNLGIGPPRFKEGRVIRYSRSQYEAYVKTHAR